MILFFFYFFLLLSAIFMIAVSHPVNSALFLISTFFNTSIIFILLNLDFLGLLFLMVYVGAIAVLFLFIVMMLNVQKFQRDHMIYFTLGSFILIFYLVQFFLLLFYNYFIYLPSYFTLDLNRFDSSFFSKLDETSRLFTVRQLGTIIYYEYFFFLLLASLVLFVAMIGAIFITNKKQGYSMRKQCHQFSRENSIITVFSC